MATRAQAEAELAALGLRLDPDATTYDRHNGFHTVIDAVGRKSFSGDCRGHVVYDFTAKGAAFWDEVIEEGRQLAPTLRDCPHPAGECDFHDDEDESNA